MSLHKFRDIERELLDLGIVVLPEVGQELRIARGDEVDSNPLPSEATRPTNPVNVLGSISRQVVVNDQIHLLDINTPTQQISRNENPRRTRTELLHHIHTLRHLHIPRNARHHEFVLGQLVGQLLDTLLAVGEDHALRDDHVFVELDEGAEFLAVLLERNVELLDTVKGQLLVLDQDLHGVLHEFVRHLDDLRRHRGREEADLDVRGEALEDLADLVDEAAAQHLVGLVEDHDFKVTGLEGAPLDEVFNSSGGADNNLDAAIPEGIPVFLGISAADAAAGIDVEELAEAEDNLVDLLGEFSGGGKDDGLALGGLGVE